LKYRQLYFDNPEFQKVIKEAARKRAYKIITDPARDEVLARLRAEMARETDGSTALSTIAGLDPDAGLVSGFLSAEGLFKVDARILAKSFPGERKQPGGPESLRFVREN
jgi:hypothetical protein